MSIDVRQRQYAIGRRGTSSSALVTENIATCTGFIGIDKKSGVVFLCHLDTFRCCLNLPDLVADLRNHVDDLSGFELFTVGGISTATCFVYSCLIAGISTYFGHFEIGVTALVMTLWFGATRLTLSRQLRRSKAFKCEPISLGKLTLGNLFKNFGVLVDADSLGDPVPYLYGRKRAIDRFKELDWRNFRLTRAEKSADAKKSMPTVDGVSDCATNERNRNIKERTWH